MIDLSKEILEVVENNLPSATAGAMKDFIDIANKNEKALEKANKTIEAQVKVISELEQRIRKLTDDLSKVNNQLISQKELEKRAIEIDDRERNIKLELSETKMEQIEKQLATVERLVEKVFGHPSVTVSNSTVKPLLSSESGYAPYQNGTVCETETKTTKHSKD